MKKRIFALALALCMMVSVMPNSFAAGILSVGDGTSTDTTVPSGGSILSVGGNTSTQLANTSALQNSILSNGSSAGQTDYEFGTATDQSQTSMTINTGSSANEQDTTTQNNAVREPTASDRLSAVAPVTPDAKQLTVSKAISETLQDNKNNPYYKIDLAAKAISNIVVETKASAIDVILILDRSSNMAAANRMSGLIKAINGDSENNTKGFLETVKETAADSRVAVVSYANAGTSTIDSAGGAISDAFVKLSDATAYNSLRTAISGLNNRIGGDAYSDEAFEKAAKIFQAVPSTNENYNNPRIVVFFTAGIPGEYGETAGWEYYTGGGFLQARTYPAYNVAQESIHWSVILKAGKGASVSLDLSQEFWTWTGHGNSRSSASTFNGATTGCGATVYCVGLALDGCDDTSAGEKHSYTTTCPGTRTNEYLYRISSHRPDGSHVEGNKRYNEWEATLYQEDWGSSYKDEYTRNLKKSFASAPASYYQVGEIDEISSMFNEIKVDVEQNKPISNVVMRDYLAPGFVPCDSKGVELSVGQTITTDDYVGTVKQDGDVYYIEWAATTMDPGEEIDASIYVKPVDTLGGRDTKTNIYGPSGLYSDDTLFASFPAPDVDVPVKEIAPNAQSFTIYLSNAADLANLVKLDDRLDGKKNAGVKVTYTITGDNGFSKEFVVAPGEAVTAFPETIINDLTVCKTYTITCTVDGDLASNTDDNYLKVSEKDGTVHVVKPQLTFTAVDVYLGKAPVFDAEPALTWVTTSPTSGHTCGTPAGKVPDIKCTFKNNKAHYLADTTVTPTANLTGTSGNTYQVVQNDFNVSVYAPVVTYQDTTIYLSENANFEMDPDETATANLVSTAWEHEGTAADVETMGAAPTLKFNYSAGESGLTACKDVSVTAVGIDGDESMIVSGTTYAYVNFTTFKKGSQETEATQFTVHVVEPVATFQDSTIYLGYTPTQNDFETYNIKGETTWVHTKDDGAYVEDYDYPDVTFGFVAEDGETYTDCAPITATVYSGGVANSQGEREFTVHVIRPTITFADQDIYLSQTPVYAAPSFAWDETCADECEGTLPENNSTDTEDMFSYSYDVDPGKFVLCTDVNVAVKIGTTDYTEYVTLKNTDGTTRNIDKTDEFDELEHEFTVHVYLPQVVLDSQNLWADYDCDVTLTDGMKDAVISEWSNQCNSNEKKDHSSNAPQCSDPVYVFTLNGNVITTYNAKDEEVTDQSTIDVALDKIKIGGIEYEFSNVTAVAYTITVNKFDLTINKTWSGADVYKQDAIFDLYHTVIVEENDKLVEKSIPVTQVVLPVGQTSVKITGLLCGQDYTVTEDTNWTWRWKADKTLAFATHAHEVSTEAPTAHTNTSVSFTNSLIETIGELWLSFCTFVQNIFGDVIIQKGGN